MIKELLSDNRFIKVFAEEARIDVALKMINKKNKSIVKFI